MKQSQKQHGEKVDYFALMIVRCLNPPTKIIGLGFDRARTKRNSANEIVYSETNKRIALGDPVYSTQRLTQQEA